MIIIAKQPGSFNLGQACQGAIEAAKIHALNDDLSEEFKTLGFTYLDKSIPKHVADSIESLPREVKEKMLLVNDQDVHDILEAKIGEIKKPIQVYFFLDINQKKSPFS